MVSTDIAERVRAGEALLDERVPGWVERIDPERLDIARGRECVLGQLYGLYSVGAGELDLSHRAAAARGLLDYGTAENAALTGAWRERVRARQAVREPGPA